MLINDIIELHKSIAPRRRALGLSQPKMAEVLGYKSNDTYIRHELYAQGMSIDTLLRVDGGLIALEKEKKNITK